MNINFRVSTPTVNYLKNSPTAAAMKQPQSIEWNGHRYTPLINQDSKASEFVKAQ